MSSKKQWPRCPKCIDGGKVTLINLENQASAVFDPLPEGWETAAKEFRCECGWSIPADQWQKEDVPITPAGSA